MESVLARATKSDVVAEPYPHLVVPDAIDADLCERLMAEFPPFELVSGGAAMGSNRRFSLPAAQALINPEISDAWRNFVTLHSSPGFLSELIELFGDHILTAYPSFEADYAPLDSLRAGVHSVHSFDDVDVLMNAQISINTPVVAKPNSVRSSHIDSPRKLFAGLFYLRHPDDDSTGGDLEITRFKSRPRGFRGVSPYDTFLEVVETVPYRRNMLVVFLNTPKSVHGVTVRSQTEVARYFMNLVAEVEKPLFDLGSLQATLLDRTIAGPEILSRRVRKLAAAR